MSINAITAFPNLTGVRPVAAPAAAPGVTQIAANANATTVSATNAQTSSALVEAIDLTLAEFGLSPEGVITADNPTANALAAQNANQASQAFLGALYQAATEAQAAALTPCAGTASYLLDNLNLATFAQQLAAAGTTGTPTQTTQSETLGALQANFNMMLNTASPLNSLAVAASNPGMPSLPVFVRAVAGNLPGAVAKVGAISPFGNIIETTG